MRKFFDWWAKLTNTKYVFYEKLGFGVNWPIITFGVGVIILPAVMLLPNGLLDVWFS